MAVRTVHPHRVPLCAESSVGSLAACWLLLTNTGNCTTLLLRRGRKKWCWERAAKVCREVPGCARDRIIRVLRHYLSLKETFGSIFTTSAKIRTTRLSWFSYGSAGGGRCSQTSAQGVQRRHLHSAGIILMETMSSDTTVKPIQN